MTILEAWIGYAIFGTAGFSILFVWAVRNKQFSDFERGRRIALGDQPTETTGASRVSRADRIMLIVLVAITIAAMAAAVLVGYRNR